MSGDTNFMQIVPFKDKICFDCEKNPPLWQHFGDLVPKGEIIYLCTECYDIRANYLTQIGTPLPLEVICDGCKTDSHNEHHCEHIEVTVDGIKTHKSCTCEECIGDSSDIQKFIGSKI